MPGIDRIEATFCGDFFEPHSHDTYALGLTLNGVQTFNYRGTSNFSLPGQIIVLHPDEIHDGASGTDDGLRYRMLYLQPHMLRRAMGDHRLPLPFVQSPVIYDQRLRRALTVALQSLDDGLEDLLADALIGEIAASLMRNAKMGVPLSAALPQVRIAQARDYIHEHCTRTIASEELERITGLDRYALARHFRQVHGTSPHRYLIMRRLDRARALISKGQPLVQVAIDVGFADQSHLNRHFKRAYGLTPGRWAQSLCMH